MNRRALACCCTLAVILAGALPAVASVNITHRCETDFFQYVDSHPIGSSWAYDIPPEYIPGGTSPSNAVTRLTAETRLAFTGAFDAYFRRLMASVCFGTAECTNYTADSITSYGFGTPLDLRTPADWCSDHTITNIFNRQTNGWYLAGHRNYAVTNITVTVTNWIGYATNIVYNPAGKPVGVKLENRYEVVSTNVLDTTRILRRYLRDHNFMRVSDINPIRGMMVSSGYYDPITHEGGDNLPAPWPDRRDIRIGSASHDVITDYMRPRDFLGWAFSSEVAAPSPSADWQPSLVQLFRTAFQRYGGSFAYFFPNTWDLFGAQNSRESVSRDLKEEADAKYLDYDTVCPDEWNAFLAYTSGQGVADGYSAMTNLVGVSFTTNTTDGLAFLPSQPLTNTVRITWAPWAGTDAYLALADTSIAGNAAMPHLRYDIEATGGVATVSYRGSGDDKWLVIYSGPLFPGTLGFHRIYEPTNAVFELVRDGEARILDSYGAVHDSKDRVELAKFDLGSNITFTVTGETAIEDAGDTHTSARVGYNYVEDSMDMVKLWVSDYYDFFNAEPAVGDRLEIGSYDGSVFGDAYFYMTGPHGTALNLAAGRNFNGIYYFHIRASNLVCSVSMPVEAATTRGPRPFDYAMDTATNSTPCLYPNPSYASHDTGVDQISGINPTALLAVGVSSNFEFDVTSDYDDGYDIVPETNGYHFAMQSDSDLQTAKLVDDFWLDADDDLADKMGEEVAAFSGANPRGGFAGILAAFGAEFDRLLTGAGNHFFIDMLRDYMVAHPVYDKTGGPDVFDAWNPFMFEVTDVSPTPSGYDIDIAAMWFNPTNGVYEAMNPQPQFVRHSWSYAMNESITTNVPVRLAAGAARGRLSGLEAVKWNFHSMHDARSTQSSAPLRVLPGGAPAADSPTTQPPNR